MGQRFRCGRLRRRQTNGAEWNRLDDYALAFHQRVRDGFLELARAEPERWWVLNGDRGVEEVQEEVRSVVMKAIESQR